ncbi:MAG: glycoside hydrolase family 1 protein [Propionibacteriaceae bacterium]|jgi:beta-glucosidase|nr:glycoside hydrolase family 1 protein [Propionibacteriaceae bacterium]
MKLDLGSLELGVATAATQIEGGNADTNWHRWAEAGGVKDGSTPARACDHWNRVDEDIALLKELGVRHYRMGLEWARIEPAPGVFDQDAIDHYRYEVKALREAGIAPLVTLHHFNNPGWVEEKGAWTDPKVIPVFLAYVRHVLNALSEWVDEWVTINEPNVYATQSYAFGEWPPGEKNLGHAMKVMSNLAQAHCRAYSLIHALQPCARVGVAHHLRVFDPANRHNPADSVGAKTMEYLFQTAVLEATCYGRFLPPLTRTPRIDGGNYFDFLGVNYYTRSWVKGTAQGTRPDSPVNDLGWEIYPDGLTQLLTSMYEKYPAPIYITENGTADRADAWRARYVYEHLAAAVESGAPVERYYHWCFTDNWEWIEGEVPRFGLVGLDYETGVRTVRPSGRFFADIGAQGGVTDEAYERWVAPAEYRQG